MKTNNVLNYLLTQVGVNTKLIFLIAHSDSLQHEVIQALNYFFNHQFSKIYNSPDLRGDTTLIVSPHFGQELYLSSFLDLAADQLKDKMESILPLAQLTEDNDILLLHDSNYTKDSLVKNLKHTNINVIQFDQLPLNTH